MNGVTTSTPAKCEFCGKQLDTTEVVLFGKQTTVPCYGSCGCEMSGNRLSKYAPTPPITKRAMHRCQMCGGTMDLDMRTGYVSDCPQCGHSCVFKTDLDAHLVEESFERRLGSPVLKGTGVPELFWDVAPDYQSADAIERSGKGMYIHGGSGTAKTLMAAGIAKAFVECGKSVRFVSSVKLLSDFKDSYGGSKSEAEVFDELNGCDLLVIDDLGKENPTSWAATMLYAVMDGRYGNMKPVVVTTNYTEGELVAKLADVHDDMTAHALMSRLFEMTMNVELDGPDRRIS